MNGLGKKGFEKIKLTALIIFCILVGSGSLHNYFNNSSVSIDMKINDQEEQGAIDDIKDFSIPEQNLISEVKGDNDAAYQNTFEEESKVNINSANSQQLQILPGIGPTKAERIIQYRFEYGGFTSIEEITQVKGIGDATFLKIKDLLTI